MTPFPKNLLGNRSFLEAYVNAIVTNIRLAVLDTDFRILWANDRFCRLTKFEEHELIGRSIHELNLICHKSSFEKIAEKIAAGIKWSGEIKTQSKDGFAFWVKTNILPIRNADDKIESYLVLNSDITTTKMALEEKEIALEKLSISEARYRALIENQPDLISLCDADGTRIFVNSGYCSFLGRSFETLVGTNVMELPLPGLPIEIIEQAFQALPSTPDISGIYELMNSKGQKFWISLRVKAIFDQNGHLFEVLTIGRDVTTLKEAELQKSNYIQDLERIAFMTSHKVRQPIATMLGLMELFRLGGIDASEWDLVLDSLKKCLADLDAHTKEMGAFIYQRQSA
jgi:PAS domain S-box-containing protein